jgi:hypothetical protein
MTDLELAALYKTTDRNIRRWKAKRAPLDNPDEMPAWIAGQRSRRLVSKTRTKAEVDDQPVTTTLPTLSVSLDTVRLDDMPYTELGRAEHIEKISARIAELGDPKAVDAWAKASAERRRIAEDVRKNASEITEGDRVLADATISVLSALVEHLEACPKHFSTIVGGNGEEVASLESHFTSHMNNCFRHALLAVHMNVRGTALESLFPMDGEWEAELAAGDRQREEFLKRPINQRQPETISP